MDIRIVMFLYNYNSNNLHQSWFILRNFKAFQVAGGRSKHSSPDGRDQLLLHLEACNSNFYKAQLINRQILHHLLANITCSYLLRLV